MGACFSKGGEDCCPDVALAGKDTKVNSCSVLSIDAQGGPAPLGTAAAREECGTGETKADAFAPPAPGQAGASPGEDKKSYHRSISATSQISEVPDTLPGEAGAYQRYSELHPHANAGAVTDADSAQEFPMVYRNSQGVEQPGRTSVRSEVPSVTLRATGSDERSCETEGSTSECSGAMTASPCLRTNSASNMASPASLSRGQSKEEVCRVGDKAQKDKDDKMSSKTCGKDCTARLSGEKAASTDTVKIGTAAEARPALPEHARTGLLAVDRAMLNSWDWDVFDHAKGDALLVHTLAMFIGVGAVRLDAKDKALNAAFVAAATPPTPAESALEEARAVRMLMAPPNSGVCGSEGRTTPSVESSDVSMRMLHPSASQDLKAGNGCINRKKSSESSTLLEQVRLQVGSTSASRPGSATYAEPETALPASDDVDDDGVADAGTVWAMLVQMREMYNSVPYHNFFHVCDVTHAVYRFLCLAGPRLMLTARHRLAILVAAVAHDLKHPGTNNSYMVNSKSELAAKYNNQSVLENYHSELLTELLADVHVNPVALQPPPSESASMTLMHEAIMGTDMAGHFKMVAAVGALIGKHEDALSKLEASSPLPMSDEEVDYMLVVLLHMADISNPMKPPGISLKWAELVMTEMFAQGDREKHEGLQVSMFCNRDEAPPAVMQMNFIEVVVAPLLTKLARILPGLSHTVPMLLMTRLNWARKHVANLTAGALPGQCGSDASPLAHIEQQQEKLAAFVDTLNEQSGLNIPVPVVAQITPDA